MLETPEITKKQKIKSLQLELVEIRYGLWKLDHRHFYNQGLFHVMVQNRKTEILHGLKYLKNVTSK